MKKKKNEQPKFKITKEEVKEIYREYELDDDNPEYDDEMKELIYKFNQLPVADKIILELYAETKSQRKTSDILGISRTTLIKLKQSIIKKIFENIDENNTFRKKIYNDEH